MPYGHHVDVCLYTCGLVAYDTALVQHVPCHPLIWRCEVS